MSAVLGIAWNTEVMLYPLTFCILLAAGLGLCLHLFLTLKAEIRVFERGSFAECQRVEALSNDVASLRAAVQALETDLRDVQRQTGMLVAPSPARSGLNLSKRTQVLRMYRAGQDNDRIAAALALPRSEVELLIKVHRMVVEQI